MKLGEQEAEKLALVVFPKLLLEIIRKYLRVEVHGLEHVPRKGRLIIAPNHSGCVGFDAVVLGHILHRETARIPRILTLWKLLEAMPALAVFAKKMGMVEAKSETGISLLKKHHMVICFPEGEGGSFKPSTQMYQLQDFHTGFVRMAILTKAPIVPTIIIGAEETHINLGHLRLFKFLKNAPIPLPLNILPLPVKWKIQFLKPIDLSHYSPTDANDKKLMKTIAEEIRALIQASIDQEIKNRKLPFFAEKSRMNTLGPNL
jgi:1-acyl-sn-glycerol-3-phosphate acyltransferase